jgi:hypothetical protein
MGCAAPHPFHWTDLRERPLDQILLREGVRVGSDGKSIEVTFLDGVYRVDLETDTIAEISPIPNRPLREEFQILLIRYLVADYGGPMDGRDISEKDLPGGVTFFQGPHALHVRPIAAKFGENPAGFEALGKALGAELRDYGDKAFRFYPFPLIPVTYILWTADEEFPASVSVLFDSSIIRWFALDMVFALVMVLTDRICERS